MNLSPSEGLSTLRLIRLEAGSGLPNLSLLLVSNTRSKSLQSSYRTAFCFPCTSAYHVHLVLWVFIAWPMGKQLFHSNWQDVQNLPLFFKPLLIRQIHYY